MVIVDAADARSDLTGWVTIDNKSGVTYANAALKLVAGDVNRAKDRGEVRAMLGRVAQAPAAEAASRFTSTPSTAGPPSRTTRPSSSR